MKEASRLQIIAESLVAANVRLMRARKHIMEGGYDKAEIEAVIAANTRLIKKIKSFRKAIIKEGGRA